MDGEKRMEGLEGIEGRRGSEESGNVTIEMGIKLKMKMRNNSRRTGCF
jgi:hypothetical protein